MIRGKHTRKTATKSRKKKREYVYRLADDNFIRQWREHRGFKTQGDLAQVTGITRATISRLESGALPYRKHLLVTLANALDCTPVDLLGHDPAKQPTVIQIYNSCLDKDDMLRAMVDCYLKQQRAAPQTK
jgi:transcriptional regulator with XRE-family HTH domain